MTRLSNDDLWQLTKAILMIGCGLFLMFNQQAAVESITKAFMG